MSQSEGQKLDSILAFLSLILLMMFTTAEWVEEVVNEEEEICTIIRFAHYMLCFFCDGKTSNVPKMSFLCLL